MSDSLVTDDLEAPRNGQLEEVETVEPVPREEIPAAKESLKQLKSTDEDSDSPEVKELNSVNQHSSNGKESPSPAVFVPETDSESPATETEVADATVIPDSQPSVSLLEESPAEQPGKEEDEPIVEEPMETTPPGDETVKTDQPVEAVAEEMEVVEEEQVEAKIPPVEAELLKEENSVGLAEEAESTDSTLPEDVPKPKRGRGGPPKSAQKEKKSFEDSLLSADEAAPPLPSGRRGRSRDVSKSDEPKVAAEETKTSLEATPEPAAKRQMRMRTPAAAKLSESSSGESATPRSLRTRGASGSETSGKRKAETPPASAKKPPAKRGRKKQSDDPFDFDRESDTEKTPIGPLRHVSVARASFGDVKFTKTMSPQPTTAKGKAKVAESSKYVNTSKAVEERQSTTAPATPASVKKARANADTVPLSKNKGTKEQTTLSPELKKQISPDDGPSSGALADISSGGSAATISQIGHPRYLDKPENVITKETVVAGGKKKPGPKKGRGRGKRPANVSLFSDVLDELNREDDNVVSGEESDEAESAEDKPPSSPAATPKPSTSAVKRRPAEPTGREPPPLLESSKKRRRTTSPIVQRPASPEYSLPANPAEQMSADFPAGTHTTLMPGCRVMARWVDKNFYAGHIIQRDGLGRYKVRFAVDGNFRDMPQMDVMPVSKLKPEDKVMVWIKEFGTEEELQPVKITKVPSTSDSDEWFGGMYLVDNSVSETTEKVCWEKFVIDKEQTKQFAKMLQNKFSQDIVEDNILSEKRERRSRVAIPSDVSASDNSPPPSPVSNTPKHRGPRVKSPASGPKTKSAVKAKKTPRNKSASRKCAGGSDEVSSDVSQPVAGDMPKLFAGKKFILTSANRLLQRNEGEEGEPAVVPFFKKQVRTMIEDRGGVVVDDFSQEVSIENCLLVADTHYRTHKYLSALARAVPCVSHMWIHKCCTDGKLVGYENAMLPAGLSLEAKANVPWHDKCPTMLKDLKVFVFTNNQPVNSTALDFVQIWSPLVKCMGATVVTEMPAAGSTLDYLLTDASCSGAILAKCEAMGASAVSSEWLIQAIITGQKPEPKAHAKYKFDFVESPPPAPYE